MQLRNELASANKNIASLEHKICNIAENITKLTNEQNKREVENNSIKRNVEAIKKQITLLEKNIEPLNSDSMRKMLQIRKCPHINRDYIASEVENMHKIGISGHRGNPHLVVSLTSYPKRMYDIHLCLYSLLTQELKPDKVVLWLGREQFPRGKEDVPKKVRNLEQWGLEIRWCEDIRSYKKLIPSLCEWPQSCIVTADDDIFYPPNWLRKLWETYKRTGQKIIAHRCHRISIQNGVLQPYEVWKKSISGFNPSYLNFFTGAGGVLYAPSSLHKSILDSIKFKTLCPCADDIWFWAMAVLNGTKIAITDNPILNLTYINPEREANANEDGTLFASNGRGGNDEQIKNVLNAFPELQHKLENAENQ